jgi:predicted nuclease of predicted toxin-antitoxin system
VRFLVDAQLPVRLARFLTESGHDAIHSSQLPDGNRTTDDRIAARADAESRAVVTKDRDFRDSHLLRRTPRRLLVIATGNITNNDLLALLETNLDLVIEAFTEAALVELGAEQLIVHASKPDAG